jgi:hypothetical protein
VGCRRRAPGPDWKWIRFGGCAMAARCRRDGCQVRWRSGCQGGAAIGTEGRPVGRDHGCGAEHAGRAHARMRARAISGHHWQGHLSRSPTCPKHGQGGCGGGPPPRPPRHELMLCMGVMAQGVMAHDAFRIIVDSLRSFPNSERFILRTVLTTVEDMYPAKPVGPPRCLRRWSTR